jgi:FAD/FMN-containing dehydrogenase
MIVNGSYLAALLGENTAHVQELLDELPVWAALVGIAGRELLPEEKVQGQEQDITAIAQQYGLRMVPAVHGAGGETILAKVMNPSGAKYWKETYKGAFQDLFFTTTLAKTSQFIEKMFELAAEAGYPAHDIGVYIQPQHMGVSYHCEFYLPYNAESRLETDRVKRLFTKASEEFSAMGAYFLRPHGIWSRLQLNKDAQSAILLMQLKKVFDPNNIMNTGKLCI